MKKGYFITFEGGEGSGKTTLIENIKHYLTKKSLPFISTREPGGTKLGEDIREILLKKRGVSITSKAELCLFLASRAQHLEEVIIPAIKEKKIVLCDRFNDSSVAYQGEARGLGIDNVISFSSYILEDAIPDLTIYLDIDPKIAMQRIKRGLDKIEEEKIIFHEKIRRGFKILQKKDPSRIKMIDASRSPKKVFDSAIIFIDYLLK